MKRALFISLFVLLLSALSFTCGPVIVLNHVTVIDGTGAQPKKDSIVVIHANRIKEIAPARGINFPKDATVIDAKGKFLIPGLWDMHVHWEHKKYLPLFIANGVTHARIMWGEPNHLRWRTGIRDGSLVGPQLIIGTRIIDGDPPVNPDSEVIDSTQEAIRMVDIQFRSKTDFIKIYSHLKPEVYLAIAREARIQRIPFEGHVPYSITVPQAAIQRQKSIEHLDGVLLACSSKENELRKRLIEKVPSWEDFAEARSQAGELVDTYDNKKAQDVFRILKEKKTWQCPTLTQLRMSAYYGDPDFREDCRLAYMPSQVRELWSPTNNCHLIPKSEAEKQSYKRLFEKQLKIVREMKQVGVPFIAGTDAYNPYCFPGFSLHDELGLFVQAGFAPEEALQTATRNAAEFAEKIDSEGTVEKGKIADLVLLEGNPLKDIRNTKKIWMVIYRGKIFNRQKLDSMLADAVVRANKPSFATTLQETLQKEGIASAIKAYQKLKKQSDFEEGDLKILESQLWQTKDFRSALGIMELHAEISQQSHLFDRLAETYLSKGDRASAIKFYKKSLAIDPQNSHARDKLNKLLSTPSQ